MSEKRAATIETRATDGAMVLRGYAALYNVETVIAGMFREEIAPGAFDEAVGRDDVRALFNHDPNYILGRTTAGNLRLSLDEVGLVYEIDIDAEDDVASRVYRLVQRGDISQSSFAFDVRGDEWTPGSASTLPLRRITRVALYDVSPVTYPAYAETSVSARDLPSASEAAAAVVAHQQALEAVQARQRWVAWRERGL